MPLFSDYIKKLRKVQMMQAPTYVLVSHYKYK